MWYQGLRTAPNSIVLLLNKNISQVVEAQVENERWAMLSVSVSLDTEILLEQLTQ